MKKKEIGNQVSFLVAKNIDMLKGDAIPKTLYLQILELCESLIAQAQQEARRGVAEEIRKEFETWNALSLDRDAHAIVNQLKAVMFEFIDKYLKSEKEGNEDTESIRRNRG